MIMHQGTMRYRPMKRSKWIVYVWADSNHWKYLKNYSSLVVIEQAQCLYEHFNFKKVKISKILLFYDGSWYSLGFVCKTFSSTS